MPALRNPKYEKFSNELAELKPLLEAFKAAGFAPHAGNATRLSKRPEVRARVQELLDEAAEFADIRRVRVLLEIDRVGRANLIDFFERDEGGTLRLRDLTALPRHVTAALAAIEWDDNGRPKIKLHDKNQANFTLLKHLGGLPEPERPDLNVFNVLSVEDQRTLADFVEALAGGTKGPGGAAALEHRPAGEVP
jgi:hypothetical protein